MANLQSLSRVNSPRALAILAAVLEHNRLMAALDTHSAFSEDATNYNYRVQDGTATIKARALNASYSATDITPQNAIGRQLAFLGQKIDWDDSHQADAERGIGLDIDVWLDRQVRKEAVKYARDLEPHLTTGDPGVTTNTVPGLLTRLDGSTDIPGATGVKGVIEASGWVSGDSVDFAVTADVDAFIEHLQLVIAEQVVGANALLMSGALWAKMATIARKHHILGESRDAFGRPVSTFWDIPMYRLNPGSFPTDEEDGASSSPAKNTTSLVVASLGEDGLSLATNSGIEVYDYVDEGSLQAENARRVKWEFRSDWKIERADSVRRIVHLKV